MAQGADCQLRSTWFLAFSLPTHKGEFMKAMEKFLGKYFIWICAGMFFFAAYLAHAQEAAPMVAAEMSDADFLLQIVRVVQELGGAKWGASVTLGIVVIISTMKVSVLRRYWDLIGSLKVLVAPSLALIAGLATLKLNPESRDMWPILAAWMIAGSGSIIVHQLLDAVKGLPFVGQKYDLMIEVIQGLLGGRK
jgi:hypothetical protein